MAATVLIQKKVKEIQLLLSAKTSTSDLTTETAYPTLYNTRSQLVPKQYLWNSYFCGSVHFHYKVQYFQKYSDLITLFVIQWIVQRKSPRICIQ